MSQRRPPTSVAPELLGAGADPGAASHTPDHAAPTPHIDGYQLLDTLGKGGMGDVWRARQVATGRLVALKFLRYTVADPTRQHTRFQREIEIASSLEHPNIARVYDTGIGRGFVYYSMQLIDGSPITTHAAQQRLDVPAIVRVMIDVCRAVDYAHERGVIHRDLKPANLLVTAAGQPFVLDFGLAKELHAERPGDTVAGDLVGTPEYMAPEQVNGNPGDVTTRTDVYALGLLLWELLVGRSPRQLGLTRAQLLRQIGTAEVPHPGSARPDLDRDLDAIVTKAVAFEPNERYGSAGELARDLERYLAGEPVTATPLTMGYFVRKKLRKHRRWVIAASAVLVVFAVLVAASFVRIQSERARAQAEAARAREALYFNHIAWADAERTHGDLRKAEMLVDACPPELRNIEWDILKASLDESIATVHQSKYAVKELAADPDVGHIVLLDENGTLWRYRLDDLKLMGTQKLLEFPAVGSARFSKDGQTLAWHEGSTLFIKSVLDPDAEPLQHSMDAAIERIAIDPTGSRIAVALSDGRTRVINPAGDVLLEFIHPRPPRIMVFSPKDELLVVGSTASMWDLSTGQQQDLPNPDDIRYVAFSSDGERRLFSDQQNGLTLMTREGEPAFLTYPRTGDIITVADIAPSGSEIACGWRSGRLTIWNWNGRFEQMMMAGHNTFVSHLKWLEDGRLISGSGDHAVRIWDPAGPAWRRVEVLAKGHLDPVQLSEDGRWVIYGDQGIGLRLRDNATGDEKQITPEEWGRPIVASLDRSGRIMAGLFEDARLRVWSPDKGLIIERPAENFDDIALSPDGRWVAATASDQAVGVMILSLEGDAAPAPLAGGIPLCWSANSRSIACVRRNQDNAFHVVVWDLTQRREIASIAVQSPISCMAFSPDGEHILIGDNTGILRSWQIGHANFEWEALTRAGKPPIAVDYSPDGNRAIVASLSLTLWDSQLGKQLLTFGPSPQAYVVARFSKDSKRITTASWQQVVSWYLPRP